MSVCHLGIALLMLSFQLITIIIDQVDYITHWPRSRDNTMTYVDNF